jgi:GGDEF domain-containing protein
MVFEQLDEALADHSGRAQDSDWIFVLHGGESSSVQEDGLAKAKSLLRRCIRPITQVRTLLMAFRQTTLRGQADLSGSENPLGENSERFLTLLANGAAQNMPEIDPRAYKGFRSAVGEIARQLRDSSPDEDKLAGTQSILREFETYGKSVEGALKDRQNGWRALGSTLLHELFARMGMGAASAGANPLVEKMGLLATSEEIQAYRDLLGQFLRKPESDDHVPKGASSLEITDRSTANDNAAGLRGGGCAVEHLKDLMERGSRGWIVFFRLGCLDIINDRFGTEAVQDCLMAVAAYITHSLHRDDVIYHWSDSILLAILQGRANQQLLSAELQRIASLNREITIKIGRRIIMLRIPLEFDITPIARLREADDLYKIVRERV